VESKNERAWITKESLCLYYSIEFDRVFSNMGQVVKKVGEEFVVGLQKGTVILALFTWRRGVHA
jgi:hypothetical protein